MGSTPQLPVNSTTEWHYSRSVRSVHHDTRPHTIEPSGVFKGDALDHAPLAKMFFDIVKKLEKIGLAPLFV